MNPTNEIQARATRIPCCSVFEEEGLVIARVELPGVPKDGLEIKIDGNELSILGTTREEKLGGKYLLRERHHDSWRKVFTIDETIDRDKIDASLENGILSLKLHVKEAAKPRRIEIA